MNRPRSNDDGDAGNEGAPVQQAARQAVFEACDWLTAAQVDRLACPDADTQPLLAERWKQEGRLFSVRRGQGEYFPSYGLDPERQYRPLAALARVLHVFGETKDGWRLAFWFASVNSWLDGRRPLDLLAAEPERVIAAAHEEARGVPYG
ncbi:hypothetical protein [Paraburkholderia nodosa]|uniref:hypothetical protein n=1 Tax=Paraburkholderia nodosa TaxID=392320 RepID=UPI00084140EB|nr:hypothetical protein [Paraburkholderia nodosa]